MGNINRDLVLPGTPPKTIRLDTDANTLSANVYNMDNLNRIINEIKKIIPV